MLALTALGASASSGPLSVDQTLTAAIRLAAVGPLPVVFELVSWLGSFPVWNGAVVVAAAGFWWWGHRRGARLLLLGLTVEGAAVSVKALVHRPQPGGWLADWPWEASFPSGHVVRAVVTLSLLVALLAWRSPRWRLPAALGATGFALLLGMARVAVEPQAHWPTDVVGGYLLGALWVDLLLAYTRWSPDRPMPPN